MTRAKVEWWDRLGLSPKKYWAAFKVTKDALLFPGTNISKVFFLKNEYCCWESGHP